MPLFEELRSEIVYTGRAFAVRRDLLRTPDGQETRLDIVEHTGSVVILPIDSDGKILFVRQYRHPTGMELLELPAGTLRKDEDPAECAHRELREETGMAAKRMQHLGSFYLAPGYSTEHMHVFLAKDLISAPLEPDADEFITLERIEQPEVFSMIERGALADAKSLAAICLAGTHLQGSATYQG